MSIREDVVASAAKFLLDPSVASSPPESRVAFLKAKNLTEDEIHAALARAGSDGAAVALGPSPPGSYAVAPYPSPAAAGAPPPPFSGGPRYGAQPFPPGYGWQQHPPPPPAVARRDWRDWFIMATVVGGVSYGLYSMTKRYIYPLVAPPTPDRLEQDKQAIDEQFTRAFALLDQLATDTEELKAAEKARTDRLDQALGSLEDAVAELRAASKRRDDDSERLRDDVRGLKDALPKALDTQRGVTDSRLREVNAELTGLKTLLGQRLGSIGGGSTAAANGPVTNGINSYLRPSAPSVASVESDPAVSTTTTPAPAVVTSSASSSPVPTAAAAAPAKAAIPAWQRAMAKPAAAAAPATNGSSNGSGSPQAEASGSA